MVFVDGARMAHSVHFVPMAIKSVSSSAQIYSIIFRFLSLEKLIWWWKYELLNGQLNLNERMKSNLNSVKIYLRQKKNHMKPKALVAW